MMYFCPTNPEHENFFREAVQTARQTLAADGEVLVTEHGPLTDAGPVKCFCCGARAEWRDARQLEMFETAPALFG